MLNARSLLSDARLLFDSERYPRAFALAFTALEEVGKAQLVADHADGIAARREFEEAFSSHKIKVAYCWRYVESEDNPDFPQLIAQAKTDIDRIRTLRHLMRPVIQYDTADSKRLFTRRNAALYVGRTRRGGPQAPDDCTNRFMAMTMIQEVESLLAEIDQLSVRNRMVGSRRLFE